MTQSDSKSERHHRGILVIARQGWLSGRYCDIYLPGDPHTFPWDTTELHHGPGAAKRAYEEACQTIDHHWAMMERLLKKEKENDA